MDDVTDKVVQFLTHGCDGPVTPFVIMARAVELARDPEIGRVNGLPFGFGDHIAWALEQALWERGWAGRCDDVGDVYFASGPADPVWYPGS